MKILTSIIALTLYVALEQGIVRSIADCLFEKIAESAGKITEDESGQKILLQKSVRKELGFITVAVGILELMIFAYLSYILSKIDNDFYQTSKDFLTLIGAWVGVKALGNYGQWADHLYGRATFYVFLIATLLNTGFGFVLGFILIKLI